MKKTSGSLVWRRYYIYILVVIFSFSCVVTANADSDTDKVENNVYDYWLNTDLSESGPDECSSLAVLEEQIDSLMQKYNPSGYFMDLDYASEESWPIHLDRTKAFLQGYLKPNNDYFQDLGLLANIKSAVDYINTRVDNAAISDHYNRGISIPELYCALAVLIDKGGLKDYFGSVYDKAVQISGQRALKTQAAYPEQAKNANGMN